MKKKAPPPCKHCMRDESAHTPGWHCQNFEPLTRRGAKKRKAAAPDAPPPDYIVQTVRTTLAKTLHYVADLLLLDPKIVAAATAQSLGDIHTTLGEKLGVPRAAAKNAAPLYTASPKKIHKMLNGAKTTDGLSVGQRAVLMCIARFSHVDTGVTPERISLLTCYTRSTRDRLLQELKALGYIQRRAFGRSGIIFITALGREKLGPVEPAKPGHAVRAEWRHKLPTGNGNVFDFLCNAFPHYVEKSIIDERLNYSRSTRDRMLQELARWDLIESEGTRVRAHPDLFSHGPDVPDEWKQ